MENSNLNAQLIRLVGAFIAEDADRSISAANRIEVTLDECFPSDNRFEEYVEALASYRPFGGDGLISEEAIVPLLRRLLEELRSG